ncbi:MAG: DNA/RNA non-specific endonuclease [Oligoflexia bacterium]|nr:DNA/RNA non-specific endonuclease [Oligoflexia bacterium]
MIMFRWLYLISLYFVSGNVSADNFSFYSKEPLNLYSDHWWDSLPFSGKKEALLIHDIFIVSFDLDKKFPAWIAYKLSPALVWGKLKAERKYVKDPLLSSGSSLVYKDWAGASNCDGTVKQGYDKAHLAPLGSFKFSPFSYQAQYLTNIVPQRRNFNQGPWRYLEERVRAFVKKGNEVKI